MNLKDYREKELKYYAVGNSLIILLITGTLKTIFNDESICNDSKTMAEFFEPFISAGIISAIIYVYVFLLDSIVSSKFKDYACNLFRSFPGEKIFDVIESGKRTDIRFTKEQVQKKYNEIYTELENLAIKAGRKKDKKQKKIVLKKRKTLSNSAWYKVYRKYESETRVFISHRDYLLCRDIYISTIWIGTVYTLFVLISVIPFSWGVIWFLIAELVLTNIASAGKQWRFAMNVIAMDISTNKETNKESNKETNKE